MPLLLQPVMFSCTRSPSPPFSSLFCPRKPVVATTFSPFPSHSNCGNTSDIDAGYRPPNRRGKRWAAVERESEFEIDRDKAREALEKLDQQLKALSEKETAPPKRRTLSSASPSSSYSDSDQIKNQIAGMRAEEPEFSGSYLTYSAVALLILTIVNNILFNVFIKPAVDGEEPAPTVVKKSLGNVTAQEAPPLEQQ